MRAKCLIEARRRRRHLLVRDRRAPRDRIWRPSAPSDRAIRAWCDVQRLAEEFGLAVGEPGDGARPDAVDRQPVAGLDDHFQRRAAEPVEQQPAERLETGVAGDAEADQELDLAVGLEIGAARAAVQLVLEFRQRVLVELLLAQLQHGLHGRHHAMAARLGEQRGVIALRLIGVGARKIDELGPAHVEQARPRRDIRSS